MIVLLTLSAASAQPLASIPTNDSKIVRRWALPGDPHGIAIGADGTVYVGLAQPQAVVAVDPSRGTIRKRVVLDSAEIAATKELVSLRTNADRTRLYIANGSDESATILALPDMTILREITIEGEPIRDALPDPSGHYLYLLGHRVHVYDANGNEELHTIEIDDPSAIAATSTQLAVMAAGRATIFNTSDFREARSFAVGKGIEAALFAGRSLVVLGRDALNRVGQSVEPICLPNGSGPQIATETADGLVLLAERRCNSSAVYSAASLYGVDAYAIAYDAAQNLLYTTERAGYLTIYRVPKPALAK
ncbi:MAG TPA: hypothetical protein VKU62_11170 [Thermoanaerobaculia bacterium]|nr:hypothetical protein [Thermoanaerobaculia bacterium]